MKTRSFRAAFLGAALLLLSGVLAPAQARPAGGETLSSLLAKHARATGSSPTAEGPMRTVYAIQTMGLTGTLTEWIAPPHRSRVEMALGPLRQTDADDGHVAWQQDSTGNVRVVRGAELVANRAAASFSIDSYDPIKDGKRGKVTLRPRREPGTGNYILDVRPVGGIPQTVYLDPKTYLVRKLVAAKGGLVGTVEILAYRTVVGQRLPSQLRIGYAGLPIAITASLSQAERLASVDAGLFAVPSSAQDFEFLAGPGAASATVAFEDDHNEIVVPVVVNGQPHKFLLDSGAGNSFITAAAAKALNLYGGFNPPALGYGGAASSKIATQATVELPGGVRLKNQNLYVIQDPGVSQSLSSRGGVDGGLGYDLLARLTVTVDYAHKTLTLTRPDSFTVPTDGVTTLPVNLEGRVPVVTASVDGSKPGQFTIDTGDSGAVHLFTNYARDNGLLGNAQAPGALVQTSVGIGGQVSEILTPGHTLTLAGLRVPNLPVATTTAPGVTRISRAAGGIGNGVLRGFDVTFDYAHSRLLLRKPAVSRELTLTPPAATVRAVDAPTTTQEVLARHLEALGGRAAVSAIKSTRVTQTVATGGQTGTVLIVYVAPDKEYEQDNLGILNTTQGYDGKTAWRRDSNGNVRVLGEDERRELRLQLFIDTNSYVLPGEGGIPGKVTLRPEREPGTGAYVLDVVPEGGKPSVLFLDPQTFLIAKEQHLDDDLLVTTTFSDYHTVDGVKFPFAQRTTNGTARYDVTAQVTKLENNVPVAAKLFTPPTPSLGAKAAFLKPGTRSATVGFDFSDGEISVPVRINGASSNILLDSGASGLALSDTISTKLHLKQEGVLEARGYGGSTDLHPVKIDTFEIPGAVRLRDLAAVSIKLPPGFDQSLSGPLAGFVGYDLLSKFVVRVDYAHQKLTFLDPAAFAPTPADGVSLPLNLDNDVPSITARFDGLPTAQFLLDTGDESALRLYGPYVTQNKLAAKYPRGIVTVGGGIGGASRSRLVRTESFNVAGVTLKNIPTEFSEDAKGGASQVLAGSLGSRLLSKFVVTFDYPHGRAFFAPVPSASQTFDTRSFGLTVGAYTVAGLVENPQMVIIDVDPASPAAKAGITTNDRIRAIDGRPAHALGITALRRLLSPESGQASHTLLVLSPEGKQRTVTISLFDPLA